MAFRKGGDDATKAAEAARGGKFAKTEYLSMEDGESIVLRYLTDKDEWPYVLQHAGAPTKNKPADHDGNWPASMPATCRYDPGFESKYTDCYIDDAGLKNQWDRLCKPTIRSWALACVRQEVKGTKEMFEAGDIEESQIGKRLGFTDEMREVDVTNDKGEVTGTKMEPRIIVVNQAPNNYFDALAACAAVFDGTVCDRDYVVKCSGEKKDKSFTHVPLDPSGLKPGSEKWGRYADAIAAQNLDLEALISDKASDEYFARFFDPNKTAPSRKKDGNSGAGSSDTAPTVPDKADDDVDQDKLAKMRERVRSGGRSVPEVD